TLLHSPRPTLFPYTTLFRSTGSKSHYRSHYEKHRNQPDHWHRQGIHHRSQILSGAQHTDQICKHPGRQQDQYRWQHRLCTANGTATLGARCELRIALCVMNAVIGRNYQSRYTAYVQGDSDIGFGKCGQNIPGAANDPTGDIHPSNTANDQHRKRQNQGTHGTGFMTWHVIGQLTGCLLVFIEETITANRSTLLGPHATKI